MNDIFKVWNILIKAQATDWPTIPSVNLPLEWYNNDKVSAFDKKTARDGIHFRVGPARLFQFRSTCDNFDDTWKIKINGTPETWRDESPLSAPWIYRESVKIPLDWYPLVNTQKEKCGYEGEIGTDLDSSQMILKFLQEKQWLDGDTNVLSLSRLFIMEI